eukprot:1991032-Pleurochrysis_carterae.AAC.1
MAREREVGRREKRAGGGLRGCPSAARSPRLLSGRRAPAHASRVSSPRIRQAASADRRACAAPREIHAPIHASSRSIPCEIASRPPPPPRPSETQRDRPRRTQSTRRRGQSSQTCPTWPRVVPRPAARYRRGRGYSRTRLRRLAASAAAAGRRSARCRSRRRRRRRWPRPARVPRRRRPAAWWRLGAAWAAAARACGRACGLCSRRRWP